MRFAIGRKINYKISMSRRQICGIAVLMVAVLGASGCKSKKKPNIPQQAQAPTITSAEPAPTQPGPAPPASVEPARPLPTPGEVASNTPPPQPAPKPQHRVARKPPKRTIVENAPPPTTPAPTQTPAPQEQGQLTASVSHHDALQQRVDTQRLLEATENNLRSVNRTLSSDEEVTVAHIRSYMQQSKNATNDGDLERAYNLALKARLLSDDLVKR